MDLILKVSGQITSNNFAEFKKQAENYINSLTKTFQTDNDFAQAEQEVKQLKVLEDKTKLAIDNVLAGMADVSSLIEAAREIAEQFRQERLKRDKLVKEKKEEIKQQHINSVFLEIEKMYDSMESDIKQALLVKIPLLSLKTRLTDSIKGKKTLDSIEKSLSTEKMAIAYEINTASQQLKQRLALIPDEYGYLFADKIQLVVSEENLENIISSRIEEEQRRKKNVEISKDNHEKTETSPTETSSTTEINSSTSKVEDDINSYIITISLNTSHHEAIRIARELRDKFGDCVKLKHGGQ